MIELRQFRQFVAIAEELSIRKAAQRLHMAQPPLTAALRKMEAELGMMLVERTNRVERLTPAGQVFLDEARRTLAQAERTVRLARQAGDGLRGSLRITFVASVAHELLPNVLRHFQASHGDVGLILEEATTAQQITALREGRTDLAIVVLPIAEEARISVEILRRGRLIAAIPQDHRLAAQATLRLGDLAREPWILFPARQGAGLHGRIMAACVAAGFVPQVAQEAIQMETITSFVAGGLGVAVVPPALSIAGRTGVVFRPLRGPGSPIGYDLALVFTQRSSVIDAFIASARSVAHSGARDDRQ